MTAWLFRAAIFIVLVFVAQSALATTYYIDNSATGCGGTGCSDSNNGTSKATAWVHAPGMPGCTSGGCFAIDNNSGTAGKAHPGDRFILRGGDVWHESKNDLTWTWRSAGTSANPIYIGVDQTWFVGSSWTRPVLNLDTTTNLAFRFGGGGQAPWNVVDNVEFTGLNFCSTSGSYGYLEFGDTPNNVLENSYFHGWTHCYTTGTTDGCSIVDGYATPGNSVLYTVFDGSDSSGGGDSCYAIFFHIGNQTTSEIAYNYVYGTGNGFVGAFPLVHDNTIAFINQDFSQITSGSYHGNALENNSCHSPCFIYNNVSLNVSPPAGVTFWDAPTGKYDYIFNNIIVNTTNGNVFDTVTGSGTQGNGGYVQFFNNTVECGHDSSPPSAICSGDSNSASQQSTFVNNHFITSAAPPALSFWGTQSNNVVQSKPTANALGYTLTQSFAFSPTLSTVGNGINEQSLCATISALNAAAGLACQSDTTYGVAYDSACHTVSFPARTPLARPVSGAWDVGAYEVPGSQTQVTQPPTCLRVTGVQ